MKVKMARACGSERGGICWEESKEDQGRTEKEGQTKTEIGGLCSGGYGGSWSNGGVGKGQNRMEEKDPHGRPQLSWE